MLTRCCNARTLGRDMRPLSGVSVTRVIDRAGARVDEHAHDWPVLSLYVLGSYANHTELGEAVISGPSAILYRAGAAHRNAIGRSGFEQVEIEFDPAWLGRDVRLPDMPVSRWYGARAAVAVKTLARAATVTSAEKLRVALNAFLGSMAEAPDQAPSAWVGAAMMRLRQDPALRVQDLSREFGLHPSWLGTAFRRATGEGVLDVTARLRVEAAARLLRETDEGCAGIALEAGFCDQSHMTRTMLRVLGRTPSAVRSDRAAFRN
jgi:AraC-like DNA-binding protein